MELKLNIYKGTKIIKTYRAEDFTLTTGICEDILNEVDIDKLIGQKLSNESLGFEIMKVVAKSFSKFRPFLQDIFEGLTDEEYRHTAIKEVAEVIVTIVQHTISELAKVGEHSKN